MPLTYDQRLRSFTAWPHNSPSESEMAAAGFVFIGKTPMYDNQGDAVKCLDCKSLVEMWFPGSLPFTEHANWKPDCPFVMAHQKAAPKNSLATSTQTSYRNRTMIHISHDTPMTPAKPYNLAKRDVEDIDSWKEKAKSLVDQRDRAVADLAAEKEAHKNAHTFWNAEAENAKASVMDALAHKDAFKAAHAAVMHEMKTELQALTATNAPLQAAITNKETLEAAQTSDLHELKSEIKALTTTITPLQAAIEGLTAAITQFQTDKVTTHHESTSKVDSHDNHPGVVRHNSNKDPINADSIPPAEANSNTSDRFETADLNEADVKTWGNWGNASTRHPDAKEGGSRYTTRNEDDSTNGAGAAEDSLSDNGLSDDDSWSNLESISPSSDGADGVGSERFSLPPAKLL